MSDLIRANEGNDDINEADPTKIHWGKFNMMGRFVDTTTQCQVQCRNSSDYDFLERPVVAELLTRRPVMNLEVCPRSWSVMVETHVPLIRCKGRELHRQTMISMTAALHILISLKTFM